MRRTVVFFPASIRSHVIPAMYLAYLLREEYEVHFCVSDLALKELIEAQGFFTFETDSIRILERKEGQYLISIKEKISFFRFAGSIRNNEVFLHRIDQLRPHLLRLNPSAIFIDIFNSTELFALYEYCQKIPIIFVNPMLSTYRISGFPAVMEGFWPRGDAVQKKDKPSVPFASFFLRPRSAYIEYLYNRQLDRLMKQTGLSDCHPIPPNITHALLFENFHECIMAPEELEFDPGIRQKNQTYFGLSILPSRKDTELDPLFSEKWELILRQKAAGDRLIYIAFGTYFKGENRPFVRFLEALIEALLQIPAVQIVISVNELVIHSLRHGRELPAFLHLFSRVPQVEVLARADLHITHGGMGSIKESLAHEVPLLVYPLEPRWDNDGNALKITHHGLGLSGSFQWERPEDLKNKILRLLEDPSFRGNCHRFRETMNRQHSDDQCRERLLSLLNLKPTYHETH